MSEIASVLLRLPTREFAVQRLFLRSAEFRALCDDHSAAWRALRHWEAQGPAFAARCTEYLSLLAEIEADLGTMLDADDPDSALPGSARSES
ncbi:hypothetical protein CNY89_11735 [Amaricoccus sp. HAR-UPW-R2A-40]|nr:hypothetical protein CNY89_11735 [Amaricoccus sp. HAR-UPW-R2A-40]